ncbi:MAG: hypothetical protein JJU29_12575 [Verrucomicrobia bacterium]|nr:hypothetical protein [Verrucomicrobiota bacterium]
MKFIRSLLEATFSIVLLFSWFYGLASLSEATYGVGFICSAGVAGIIVRIIQAERHQHEAREGTESLKNEVHRTGANRTRKNIRVVSRD